MTADDPGLVDALAFGERLRTGAAKAFSPEETKAARLARRSDLEDLRRMIDTLPGKPKP